MTRALTFPTLLASVAFAAPALAGNVVPIEIEPAPVIAVPAPVLSFAGGYAGGSLGYGHADADLDGDIDGDDDDDDDDDDLLDAFDLEDGDVAYGLHAGYNFQNGNIVWGPELAIFGGGGELGGEGNVASIEAELDYGARLALRGGYALGPNLIYGLLGAAYLEVESESALGTDSADDVGFAAGLGYERLITDNFILGAQYILHSVDDLEFSAGDGSSAELDYRVIELRASFKF